MATEFTKYFKEQFRSPQPVQLPDPHAIRKFIQREQRWEPLLSQSFLIKNKVLASTHFLSSDHLQEAPISSADYLWVALLLATPLVTADLHADHLLVDPLVARTAELTM